MVSECSVCLPTQISSDTAATKCGLYATPSTLVCMGAGLGGDGIETSDLANSSQFANLIMNLDMLRAIGHGSKTIKKK